MRLGQHVRVPDGRIGTAIFNGLTGVGIKWGRHDPRPEDFEGSAGDCGEILGVHVGQPPKDWPWFPDAMLRSPDMEERLGLPCVCEEFEVELLGAE